MQYGELGWVKIGGYPYWPARRADVLEVSSDVQKMGREELILVYFFGSHDYAWVDPTEKVRKWDDNFEKFTLGRKGKMFQFALEEAYEWQKQTWRKVPTRRRSANVAKPQTVSPTILAEKKRHQKALRKMMEDQQKEREKRDQEEKKEQPAPGKKRGRGRPRKVRKVESESSSESSTSSSEVGSDSSEEEDSSSSEDTSSSSVSSSSGSSSVSSSSMAPSSLSDSEDSDEDSEEKESTSQRSERKRKTKKKKEKKRRKIQKKIKS